MTTEPAASVPSWTIPPTVDHQPERNAQRAAIHDWLNRKAPSLAELYVAACYLVYTLPVPGRARLIAHAVREICNSLPAYVLGIKGGARVEYADAIETIRNEWMSAGLPLVASDIAGSLEVHPPVSKPLVDLLTEHGTRNTAADHAAQLFAEADPTGQTDLKTLAPLVERWKKDTKWGVALAHDPRKEHEAPDAAGIQQRFELVEDHLYGLSGQYFAVAEEIDAILAEANA